MTKEKEAQGKSVFVKRIIAVMGADIIVPEPLAKPVIDKVESNDAWVNLQIAVGNVDEKSRKDLILAAAVKFLKHTELLDLAHAIGELVSQLMEYMKDNPDCRTEPDQDAIHKLLTGDDEI